MTRTHQVKPIIKALMLIRGCSHTALEGHPFQGRRQSKDVRKGAMLQPLLVIGYIFLILLVIMITALGVRLDSILNLRVMVVIQPWSVVIMMSHHFPPNHTTAGKISSPSALTTTIAAERMPASAASREQVADWNEKYKELLPIAAHHGQKSYSHTSGATKNKQTNKQKTKDKKVQSLRTW